MLSGRFLIFLLISILLIECKRLKVPPLPEGVPAQSTYNRKTRLYSHKTATGLYTVYYDNGILAQRGETENGRRRGIWLKYSLDGNSITASGRYEDDRRIGTWRYFDQKGSLYLTIRYKKTPVRDFGFLYHRDYGNENGPYERYFPDGSLEERGQFRGGYYHGLIVRYYRNGRKLMVGKYLRDKKTGLWKYYYPEGVLEREEIYKNGRLHGLLRNFKPDGRLYQKVLFHNGKRIENILIQKG